MLFLDIEAWLRSLSQRPRQVEELQRETTASKAASVIVQSAGALKALSAAETKSRHTAYSCFFKKNYRAFPESRALHSVYDGMASLLVARWDQLCLVEMCCSLDSFWRQRPVWEAPPIFRPRSRRRRHQSIRHSSSSKKTRSATATNSRGPIPASARPRRTC